MHVRRLACFFLGVWFAGSLLVLLATSNPGKADRALLNLTPNAAVQFKSLPPAGARSLLFYAAAERNRELMDTSDIVQLVYGAAFFIFLLFGSKEGKWSLGFALWMVAAVLLQKSYLTPEITDLGRLTDFLPPDAVTSDRAKLWVLQNAYYGVEAVKWMGGLALMARLTWFSSRSGDAREDVHVVNKADHRHIYR